MWLNCDLGESFGAWTMGLDSEVMPYIDAANIACGFHAGDPVVIAKTLSLAKQHNLKIGAHPSYPDKEGFGRRSMKLQPKELINCLHYQIAAVEGMAKVQNVTLDYVKPHGALYNDMMDDVELLKIVMQAISSYSNHLKLMMLATKQQDEHRLLASQYGISLYFEAFADRLYTDEGKLVSRTKPNAVHDKEQVLIQVKQLANNGCIITETGQMLYLEADTLCVHGDNLDGITEMKKIKAMLMS
ncbi:5-oxoprolinase subunit PxpA (plasmid) [Pseudoalteromonas xiamenensis]|uniref:5-oxoprolinase subunit PxpA n=1 Tax=Pseudoalteromonas xiamenensis TaxID=882626 RepID=UPI0027E4569C|nr:5-oxoprolinase subunit PxpA [Pseudoalteromonas xiamenensis]WMN61869.1 5-oxoprolinase subunit PxpA [Pseudoalteromonas xiamenensis]